MLIRCDHCGAESEKAVGHVNRSRSIGARLFCNRTCTAAARKKHKPAEQKIAEKADYDRRRRNGPLREKLRQQKRDYFARTYDPEAARVYRAGRMHKHVAYCRRPEYRAKKSEYDLERRLRLDFGDDFAEVAMLLRDLESEIGQRMSRYEIMLANGTLNKALRRRRENENPLGL